MFVSEVREIAREVTDLVAKFRARLATADGDAQIEGLKVLEQLRRELAHDTLATIARLDRSGEFDQRGVTAQAAVADLFGCHPAKARRQVAVARSVFPTTLDGQPVEPRLPATAAALGRYVIDSAHADVIERLLDSPTARRLRPDTWTGVETQLAEWAALYRPDELRRLGTQLLEALDQDGTEPEHELPQLNELHLYRSRDGAGGRIKGQLDTETFTALTLALEGHRTSGKDDDKSLAERDADALGSLCTQALNDADLPDKGGERPQLTVIIQEKDLRRGLRGATLDTGRITASYLRRLACDCALLPVVMSGDSQPLDAGRTRRSVDRYQRRAVAARDRGCAWYGCGKKARFCEVHHIKHWADGGPTNVNNLIMLCWTHHRMIHHSGWQVHMRKGWPEFIPPKWIDHTQTPRRKPRYPLIA